MLRPSSNHGTQRMHNDDDDDDEWHYVLMWMVTCSNHLSVDVPICAVAEGESCSTTNPCTDIHAQCTDGYCTCKDGYHIIENECVKSKSHWFYLAI